MKLNQKGNVKGYSVKEVNNKPLIEIYFDIPELGKSYRHNLWFTDKVTKSGKTVAGHSCETLAMLGYTGKLSEITGDVSASDMFNTEKLWDLKLEADKNENGELTGYYSVRFVNDPDNPKNGSSKVEKTQAVKMFKGFEGEMLTAKKSVTTDDVPF